MDGYQRFIQPDVKALFFIQVHFPDSLTFHRVQVKVEYLPPSCTN